MRNYIHRGSLDLKDKIFTFDYKLILLVLLLVPLISSLKVF